MHCGQHGVSCLHQKEESVISGRSCAGAAGSGAGDAVLVAAGPWGSRWLWFMHSQTQVQVAGIRDFSLGNLAGNVFRGKREAGVFGFIGELDPFFSHTSGDT